MLYWRLSQNVEVVQELEDKCSLLVKEMEEARAAATTAQVRLPLSPCDQLTFHTGLGSFGCLWVEARHASPACRHLALDVTSYSLWTQAGNVESVCK